MRLFDTHCHLNDQMLINQIDDVILRANKVGVDRFVVIGWDKESSLTAIKLAEQYDSIYAAVGYHPENLENINDDDLEFVLNLSKHPKVVAIGEIGLDYHWEKDLNKREIQKEYFIKQIEYANKNNLPIIIHNRDAYDDCLKILKEHKPLFSGVLHCYSGSVEYMQEIFNLDLYIGLDGPVTFTNAKTPKEVAREVPLERLLLETDSPYLAPHPLRGTVNEPANVGLVLDEIARLKEMSKKHLCEVVYSNSCKLFKIDL